MVKVSVCCLTTWSSHSIFFSFFLLSLFALFALLYLFYFLYSLSLAPFHSSLPSLCFFFPPLMFHSLLLVVTSYILVCNWFIYSGMSPDVPLPTSPPIYIQVHIPFCCWVRIWHSYSHTLMRIWVRAANGVWNPTAVQARVGKTRFFKRGDCLPDTLPDAHLRYEALLA